MRVCERDITPFYNGYRTCDEVGAHLERSSPPTHRAWSSFHARTDNKVKYDETDIFHHRLELP